MTKTKTVIGNDNTNATLEIECNWVDSIVLSIINGSNFHSVHRPQIPIKHYV